MNEPRRIPRRCLRNPVNRDIADELLRLALPDAWLVAGCLVQTVWNGLTESRARSRHQRLRCVLFRSRHVVGGRGRRDPARCRARSQATASRSRRATRRASISGIREKHGLPYPPLRSSTEGIDRFLTKNTKRRNPPHARRLRCLCARRFRRHRRHDRAAQSGLEFFGGELRGSRPRAGRSCGRKLTVLPAIADEPKTTSSVPSAMAARPRPERLRSACRRR